MWICCVFWQHWNYINIPWWLIDIEFDVYTSWFTSDGHCCIEHIYTSLQVLYSSCRHLLIVQVMSSHVKNYFTMMDVCFVSCETLLLTCTLMQLPIVSHRYIQVLYIYILLQWQH